MYYVIDGYDAATARTIGIHDHLKSAVAQANSGSYYASLGWWILDTTKGCSRECNGRKMTGRNHLAEIVLYAARIGDWRQGAHIIGMELEGRCQLYHVTLAEHRTRIEDRDDIFLPLDAAEHYESCRAAVLFGKPVRAEVLADYPELQAQASARESLAA